MPSRRTALRRHLVAAEKIADAPSAVVQMARARIANARRAIAPDARAAKIVAVLAARPPSRKKMEAIAAKRNRMAPSRRPMTRQDAVAHEAFDQ